MTETSTHVNYSVFYKIGNCFSTSCFPTTGAWIQMRCELNQTSTSSFKLETNTSCSMKTRTNTSHIRYLTGRLSTKDVAASSNFFSRPNIFKLANWSQSQIRKTLRHWLISWIRVRKSLSGSSWSLSLATYSSSLTLLNGALRATWRSRIISGSYLRGLSMTSIITRMHKNGRWWCLRVQRNANDKSIHLYITFSSTIHASRRNRDCLPTWNRHISTQNAKPQFRKTRAIPIMVKLYGASRRCSLTIKMMKKTIFTEVKTLLWTTHFRISNLSRKLMN